jgi:hypothetical protein
MNLLMAATPIAMQQCGLPFSDAALVLEWHVIGMFAPGFFTGHLIKRFGTLPIMGVGAGAQPAVHADRADGRGAAAVPGGALSCWAWAGISFSPAAPRWRSRPTARRKKTARRAR